MNNTAIFSILITTLWLQSCSSNNEEPASVPTPPHIKLDKKMKEKEANEIPVHETSHEPKPSSPSNTTPKSVLINGIKMQPSEFPIVKGTRIFVPNVSQYAAATGDIIVVSNSTALPDDLMTAYKVSSIAVNTFKLIPIQANADLLKHYHTLQKLDFIKQVELSIFYEGLNDNQLEIK
jgi:hypothetical protein